MTMQVKPPSRREYIHLTGSSSPEPEDWAQLIIL